MTNKTLLLSIRPKYASKIFNGVKKVELRKVKPKLNSGDVVLVYVSSPIKELQGTFIVEQIVESSPDHLWQEVKNIAGVSKKEFDDYYSGSTKSYGIFFKTPRTLVNPISLIDLRKLWNNFHPPQSYRYLSSLELKMISTNP